MEHLIIRNEHLTLFELLSKIDSGNIVMNQFCRYTESFGNVDNILNGLYNPIVWVLEDSIGVKTILYRSNFLDFLRRFHTDETSNDYGIKFSSMNRRNQNKFEDSNFTVKVISYHPNIDVDKVIRMLDYNH
jgi:hypothetical protein